MKVFISSDLSKSPWKNSSIQASIFMHECLKSAGLEVYILNVSNSASFVGRKNKFYNLSDISDPGFPKVDVLILCGGDIPVEKLVEIKKMHDSKIILYQHLFSAAIHQENFTHGGQLPPRLPMADEIWVPEHHNNSMEYVNNYYNPNASIKSVPYLWDSSFVNASDKKDDARFRGKEKKSIVILEDNEYSFKSSLVPMMICEKAFYARPELLETISVANTQSIKKNQSAMRFIGELNINTKNKLHLTGGWNTMNFISRIGKYVLSYQENNNLNYLFLECLYLGIPLIHNSEYIKSYGYYYDGISLSFGANQLINSLVNHEENLEVYKEQNKFLLKSFSPQNHKNKSFYMACVQTLIK